jgi:hypothetical protein
MVKRGKRRELENAHSLAETKKGVINVATKTGKKSNNLPYIVILHGFLSPNALHKVCNDLESSYVSRDTRR